MMIKYFRSEHERLPLGQSLQRRKLDKLHVVQRLGSKSLKRYQRYYKVRSCLRVDRLFR
jgi:hypothetical protein